MALVNRCQFRAAAGGTGTFTVSSAITGYLTPAQADAVNLGIYNYAAESDDRTQWEIGIGTYTVSGTTLTRAVVLKSSNANAAVNFSVAPRVGLTPLASDVERFPPNFLSGGVMSNNVTDATNDINFPITWARDSTDTVNLVGAAMTKQLDVAWAAGPSLAGGKMSAAGIADTTYHCFIIGKLDGTTDFGFDTSPTAPTMPSGYVYFRRIGSIIRASGAILQFRQRGDEFLLSVPVLDHNTVTLSTTAADATLSSVPNGIVVEAILNVRGTNAGGWNVLMTAKDQADTTPTSSIFTLRGAAGVAATAAGVRIRTDTARLVRTRSDAASTSWTMMTTGWIDRRGQDG